MTLALRRDFDPRHGEPVELAPGVRRVTAPNAGPFTFRGTNTFLIGENELAVIDPGPADDAHVDALMRAIGGASVAQIVLTHTHRDHSGAVPLLKARTGAPAFAAGQHRPARTPCPGEDAALDAAGDAGFSPDVTLADGSVVEGSGFRLEAIATPGHTRDHLAFALDGAGMIFSGDHVMGWSTTVVAPPEGAMADYMASLDRMLERSERRYLPAHGGDIPDGPAHVRALKAHRRMREAAILQEVKRGAESVDEIVERVYRGLDPRLLRGAALSTLAHLEDLAARGAIVADGPATLAARYRPAAATPDAPGD